MPSQESHSDVLLRVIEEVKAPGAAAWRTDGRLARGAGATAREAA